MPTRFCAGVIAALLAAGAGPTTAPGWPADGDLELVLDRAVWRAGRHASAQPLTLWLARQDGAWRALVVGHSRRYNWGDHYGVVATGEPAASATRLTVTLRLEPDPWSGGAGWATYDLVFNPQANGVGGTWSGSVRDEPGQGTFTGRWHARQEQPRLAPDAHPRLLIRPTELPALRAKAKTPWGQTVLPALAATDKSKSNMAVGQALLYALTGDPAHARRACDLLEDDWQAGRWFCIADYHDPAAKVTEAAVAFDLVYDACTPAFRSAMLQRFADHLPYLYRGADHPLFNDKDGSNWSALFRSGATMAALSLVGRPTDLPPRPQEPAIQRLSAPPDLQGDLPPGMPVVTLQPGLHWGDWVMAGPLNLPPGADPLADAGGPEAFRPHRAPASSAASAHTQPAGLAFAPLPPAAILTPERAQRIRKPDWAGAVDLAVATQRRLPGTCALYAVLDNPQPGHYRVEALVHKMLAPRLYLAGCRVEPGDIVWLPAGRVPVLAVLPLAKVSASTGLEFFVRLHPATDDDARRWLALRRAQHAVDLALWTDAQRRRAAGQWADPQVERWLAIGRQRLVNWTRDALGPGGWNMEGEAYTQHSLRLVLPAAHGYRNLVGRALSDDPNLPAAFSMYVAKTLIGGQSARMPSYGPGGGPLGVDNWARGFGLIGPALRPACAWTWTKTVALAKAGRFKATESLVDTLDPMSGAYLLVNWPLDSPDRNPADLLPRAMADTTRGGYVFRNRWQDESDLVATIFLNANNSGGGWTAPDAGDFRISGLGVDWAVRGIGWGNGGSSRRATNVRWNQNVFQLASAPASGAGATGTFYAAQPDGSGQVSLDLDAVFALRPAPQPGTGDDDDATPGPATSTAPTVQAWRTFAVDYSGASGTPALYAVVDAVGGTDGQNVWQLVSDGGLRAQVEPDGFTLSAPGGATLRAWVLAPPRPRIEATPAAIVHEINYHGAHKRAPFARTVVNVRPAADAPVAEGEFFWIVMALQAGDPPAAQITGAGPAAEAVIGRRSVRLDGQRILLGQPTPP